jgi:hypothetical protein
MSTVLNDYQKVRGALAQHANGIQLPLIQSGGFSHEPQKFHDSQTLWRAVLENRPTSGWYLWSSGKSLQEVGQDVPAPQGYLISAELLLADQGSLHVRYLGSAIWLISKFYHHPDDQGYVWDEIFHLRDGGGKLRYRRYFLVETGSALTLSGGTRPVAACFLGFDKI